MGEREWDPTEWQAYCEELLTVHYGTNVQLIPDRGQGDGGLEALVPAESKAFQCYAPEQPFSLQAQTNAQREKIRSDTQKLLDHQDRTERLVGDGATIKEWVLLTPAFEDKSLVEFANERSRIVRRLGADHSWCDPEFRISLHTDTLFSVARAKLQGAYDSKLIPATPRIEASAVRSEVEFDDTIESTLKRKLVADKKLGADASLLSSYMAETLIDYFRGGNELSRLSREVPTVHARAVQCSLVVFDSLARSLAESDERPTIVVRGVRTELESLIGRQLPGLGMDLVALLARYFIASWWIQCPLQFADQSRD